MLDSDTFYPGPGDNRRDQVIYYQYKADRARRTLHGIDQQIVKAENAVAGKAPVKRNRFIALVGADKSVNRTLEAKARALAGWKGYTTNLATCPDSTPVTAEFVIDAYHRLYQIEAELWKATGEERKQVRRLKAPEIWKALKKRSEELQPKFLPKSTLGGAIRYFLNEYTALVGYLRDGRFEIDQNLVENSIRPTAVGRRRWLFLGHPDAGWRSAVIYSILASCRRRGIAGCRAGSSRSAPLPRCWRWRASSRCSCGRAVAAWRSRRARWSFSGSAARWPGSR